MGRILIFIGALLLVIMPAWNIQAGMRALTCDCHEDNEHSPEHADSMAEMHSGCASERDQHPTQAASSSEREEGGDCCCFVDDNTSPFDISAATESSDPQVDVLVASAGPVAFSAPSVGNALVTQRWRWPPPRPPDVHKEHAQRLALLCVWRA